MREHRDACDGSAETPTAQSRRMVLKAGFVLATAFLPRLAKTAVLGEAGPIESLALDERARVLKQETVSVPASSGGSPGIAGADIYAPARGLIGIDWALPESREFTVMIVTQQQKNILVAGRVPNEDPLLRADVEGPETAGATVVVNGGSFFIAFLNRAPRPVSFVYRASFRAF
jgi:hypothetical protein